MKKIFVIFLFLFGLGSLSSCSLFHSHSYTDVKYDETNHWDECSCGDKQNIEAHTFDNGLVIQEATAEADGIIEYTCTICGYFYQDTLEFTGHRHDYSTTWSSDTSYHWHACSGCDEKDSLGQHTFTEKITKEADFGESGTITYTCSVCNYSYTDSYELSQDEYNEEAKAIKSSIGSLNSSGLASEYTTMVSLATRYSKLNETAKALVTNYKTLENLKANIDAELQETIDAINNIGVIYESESLIQTARTKFNKFEGTDLEKYITNKAILIAAETEFEVYAGLKESIENKDTSLYQQLVYNVANLYYKQGTQIQYDQYLQRRNFHANPEDANSYNYTYLDCSSFVNAVYYYIFGSNIITTYGGDTESNGNSTYKYDAFAENYYGSKSQVIFYSDSESSKTDSRAAEIRALLQPGDIYVYRHGSAGHVMLYVGTLADGKDYFLHCTGTANGASNSTSPDSNYTEKQSTTEKNKGAIVLEDADAVFVQGTASKTGTDRYIFADSNTSWSIMRPLEKYSGSSYKITNQGISRILYPTLNFEKTCSIGNYHSVAQGSTIKYTISVNNFGSSAAKYVYAEATLPEGVDYVISSSGSVYDESTRTIKWHIASINAGATSTLTYTVKATGNAGTDLLDIAHVNGVRSNMHLNEIVSSSTSSKLSNVVTKLKSYVGQSFTSMSAAINQAYNEVYGVDNIVGSADSTIINNLFGTFSTDYTVKNKTYSNMVASSLYGGYYVRYYTTNADTYCCYDDCRNVLPTYLEAGDVIVTWYNSTYTVYFYASATEIYSLTDGVVSLCYSGSTSVTVTQFLHSLPYYNYYAVIRPALGI